jgi:hypothetical protein
MRSGIWYRRTPPNKRICDPFTRNRTMRQKSPGVWRMSG